MSSERRALVVGVTGMVGLSLSQVLLRDGWEVYGISRTKKDFLPPEVKHVAVDLTNKTECQDVMSSLVNISHIFYTTWLKKSTEAENCEVNSAMVENVIDNVPLTFKHFVLVTGTKHYMGTNEGISRMKEENMETPFKETLPRKPGANFYYALEDVVLDRAAKLGFTWSVARPHIVIGYAPQNQMNFFTSIAVYAAICKFTGEPFIFPGKKENYYVFLDAVDAEAILAEHLLWEATEPKAENQAFNVVNGDAFRWKSLWPKIADYFGIEPIGPGDELINLTEKMAMLEPKWAEMVKRYKLQVTEMTDVATWWMVAGTTSRTVSCLTDMTKSRELGFLKYQSTEKSIFNLFDKLRSERIIP